MSVHFYNFHAMKNKKLRFGKYLVLSILLLPFVIVSCEKDSFDVRDQMLGFYDYELKAYLDTQDGLVYIGDQPGHYDVTGKAELIKNPDYNDMIDFWEGSDFLFQAVNLKENDNSITFDIPIQEFWLGPVPVTVRGYDYWNVDNNPYHGAFLYRDKSVEVGLAAEVMDVSSDLVLVFTAYRD